MIPARGIEGRLTGDDKSKLDGGNNGGGGSYGGEEIGG